MAKTGNSSASREGEGLESGTPKDATVNEGPKDGIHLAKPRTLVVGDYPERPYSEAVTAEHAEVLRAAGQEPV